MSGNDLYTVTICTSKPVTRKTGTVNQDLIETYYDATWPMVLAYRKKSDGEITVEKQRMKLDKLPKIETSESVIAAKRFPTVPRLNIDLPKSFTPAQVSAITRTDPTITNHGGLGSHGYAELVNVMNREAQ